MKRIIKFFYVSGRGWVTLEPLKCSACGQLLPGPKGERSATDAEYLGLIVPKLASHYPSPYPREVKIELEEVDRV